MRARILAGVIVVIAFAGCGSDDDNDAATVATTADGPAPVVVSASNYKYGGLPASAPAGTKFSMTNDSTDEVHEMVMLRIPDTEKRPVAELITLPEAETDAIFGDAPPAAVIVGLPGKDGKPVVGDGTLTEPGRYAVVCFIPVGADVDAAAAAMTDPTAQGVPGDGPPHVTKGMFAEITIE